MRDRMCIAILTGQMKSTKKNRGSFIGEIRSVLIKSIPGLWFWGCRRMA